MPTRSPSIVPEPPTAIAAEQRHPADDLKTPDEVDYFAMLSRAVARLDRDSYEARGAIYDRAREFLAKRLASATPPYSKDEAAKQHLALRQAIRRIEFEDREDLSIAVQPISGEETNGSNPDGGRINSKRKRLFGRVAARLLIAALILGIGIGAYAYSTGSIDLTFLTRLLQGTASSGAQRASLYERRATDPNAPAFEGTANWQIHSEGTGLNPETVLQVDVQIPERGLALVLSMRREPSEAAAMSHLIELRFLGAQNQLPFAEIYRIGSIGMSTAEHSRRAVLMGIPTKVTPGVFLFGLTADEGEREANVRFMRELPWLDIPIVYEDGSQALLSIEKGAAGERVVNQFFSDPGQR